MALGRRVPIVYRNIGEARYWASSPAKRARVRLLLDRTHLVVTLWVGATQQLHSLGVPAERIAVIPQWVDADIFSPPTGAERARARAAIGAPDGVPVVGVVAALRAEKDVGLAIEAAAEARAFLVVVGDGPLRAALEGHASSRLSGRHRFTGSTERTRDVLAAVDALAVTSRSEGMPGVALEAAAMGIPVVATAVGSLPELFDEGIVAELVQTPDPDLVAEALVRTWNQPDVHRGARARTAVIARHSIDGLVPRWEAVLGRALRDRRVRSGADGETTS
jgi:glycosyltransferase involved in cell wall biosynthesis